MVDFYIITGLSGAGKTHANKCFEDMGFYCIDNLPPALIPNFAELCSHSDRKIDKVSLVLDIRGGEFFDDLFKALEALDKAGHSYHIVFLDSSDEALVRRFKETRRAHPLAGGQGSILNGISIERVKLQKIKERADFFIDTTEMNPWRLKQEIVSTILGGDSGSRIGISIITFGYKYGIPLDADIVLDVRFLPNPYYDEALKDLRGTDVEVYEFVMKNQVTQVYVKKLADLILFMLPHSLVEGKANLVIAVGCTGGHHRSVVVGIELARMLSQKGYEVKTTHRDLNVE
jgi:RNase adapter protein RapZ